MFAVSIVLLGVSASLAGILYHDGIGIDAAAASNAPVGSHVRMRGQLAPYPFPHLLPGGIIPDDSLGIIEGLVPHEPFRFLLVADGIRVVVLSATDHAAGIVVLDGTLVARMQDSVGGTAPASVAVVRAESWTQPILFR